MNADHLDALLDLGRVEEAEALARRLLSASPGDAYLQTMLAWSLIGQSRNEEALAEAERAVSAAPDDLGAQQVLAEALYRCAHLVAALRAASRCLELQPNNAMLFLRRALIEIALVRRGRLRNALTDVAYRRYSEAAHSDLDRALALAPTDSTAHKLRADLLLYQGKPAAAREAATRCLALDPADAYAHYVLGEVSAGEGDSGEAAEHLVRSGRADPRWNEVEKSLARLGRKDVFPAFLIPISAALATLILEIDGIAGFLTTLGFIAAGTVVRVQLQRRRLARLPEGARQVIATGGLWRPSVADAAAYVALAIFFSFGVATPEDEERARTTVTRPHTAPILASRNPEITTLQISGLTRQTNPVDHPEPNAVASAYTAIEMSGQDALAAVTEALTDEGWIAENPVLDRRTTRWQAQKRHGDGSVDTVMVRYIDLDQRTKGARPLVTLRLSEAGR